MFGNNILRNNDPESFLPFIDNRRAESTILESIGVRWYDFHPLLAPLAPLIQVPNTRSIQPVQTATIRNRRSRSAVHGSFSHSLHNPRKKLSKSFSFNKVSHFFSFSDSLVLSYSFNKEKGERGKGKKKVFKKKKRKRCKRGARNKSQKKDIQIRSDNPQPPLTIHPDSSFTVDQQLVLPSDQWCINSYIHTFLLPGQISNERECVHQHIYIMRRDHMYALLFMFLSFVIRSRHRAQQSTKPNLLKELFAIYQKELVSSLEKICRRGHMWRNRSKSSEKK